jgi:hypothetical protein
VIRGSDKKKEKEERKKNKNDNENESDKNVKDGMRVKHPVRSLPSIACYSSCII